MSNQSIPVLIVAALTLRPVARIRPTDVLIQPEVYGLQPPWRVPLGQTRTIDKRDVVRYIGQLTAEDLAQIDEAIKISLGLVPL